MGFARKLRATLAWWGKTDIGVLGISSETCEESRNERFTATSAPPAEIFQAVANSRNSLPESSRLRTNTGMASGRRSHFRRSALGFLRLKHFPHHGVGPVKAAPGGPKYRENTGHAFQACPSRQRPALRKDEPCQNHGRRCGNEGTATFSIHGNVL
jgi:hypothetical protein